MHTYTAWAHLKQHWKQLLAYVSPHDLAVTQAASATQMLVLVLMLVRSVAINVVLVVSGAGVERDTTT